MFPPGQLRSRVRVDGKFFRLGEKKFPVKGVAYGPFAPDAGGAPFASREQTAHDFRLIRELGANLVRIYSPPPAWFLDLAEAHELRLLVDISWNQHVCFLDSPAEREQALAAVRAGVRACAGHPAVLAFSVANEIAPDVVRWHGAAAVADFLDRLVAAAKETDPECLCTYTNFPSTEFLRPRSVDFLCFNLYLHQRQPFEEYLARLQMVADGRPLLLGEFGMDGLREGEPARCEFFAWQIESAFRGGAAGAVVFSFTDDWHRGGQPVEGWAMGLTTRERQPKPCFHVVAEKFAQAPYFPLPRAPRVSVVVASYNGARTLPACLDSLEGLNYPDYEILLVDDGSTDATRDIAARHPRVRCVPHERNLGLSVARNTGILAATGEIVAFTDADCRADEDWLHYLVGDLLRGGFAGMGGPNLLPPEDSPVAAAVMVSPGGPAHVLLSDRQAEHIPGCNMAFFKQALLDAGLFDPAFTRAGDDVDLCWRLQQMRLEIGFSPAAFVWHYRRATVRDYLKQQRGYGEAEALLVRKHPEYFNAFGGSLWRGRIYTPAKFGPMLRGSFIYRGSFGSAGFQTLYASTPASALMLCTTLEYYVLIAGPLWVLALTLPLMLPLALTSLLVPLGVCGVAGWQAELPRDRERWWSRSLIALLFLLQPVVRGLARYQGRLWLRRGAEGPRETLDSVALRDGHEPLRVAEYWCRRRLDRLAWIAALLDRLDARGWPNRPDTGWSEYDVEIAGPGWTHLQLTTVAEEHPAGQQLLRCRLKPRWSLRAKALFWGLAGLLLAAGSVLGGGFAPAWLLPLLGLPALAWFFHRQSRNLQSIVMVFLDELAKDLGLLKLPLGGVQARPAPAQPAASAAPPAPPPAPPAPPPSAG